MPAMPTQHPTDDYPRPQLVRAGRTGLDGAWGFALDERDEGLAGRWFASEEPFTRTIQVPFPPESAASGIGEDVACPFWYRREFTATAGPDERLLLHFEGVDHSASVWVNGTHVGDHEGGQTRFSIDVTHAVRSGTNVVVVRALDPVEDLEQPRGKQDWLPQPHVIWYRRTSGIWRSVWLERVPATRVDRLVLRPSPDLASVAVEARLAGPVDRDGHRLEVELSRDGRLLSSLVLRCTSGVVRTVAVIEHETRDARPEELWWTPESPTLVDVSVRLLHGDDVVDTVTSYVGLRTVGTDGSSFLLNGRPYFLRLVLEQGYWPDTHLASPSAAALRAEVELIKALGFNGIRMHQTSADPRLLAECDRAGLVVFADTAATYQFSDVALLRTTAELCSLVERDVNHPCVVAWVPFNESWGLPALEVSQAQRDAVRGLYHLLKALDPDRLALGNDGWEYVVGDVVGVHDYAQEAGVLADRYGSTERARRSVASGRPGGRVVVLPGHEGDAARVPVMVTEFGGISAHDEDGAWEGYGDVVSPDLLPDRIGSLTSALVGGGIAGYCYTQLTDTAQEKNGLLTEGREPKCSPERIRAAVLGAQRDGR
jgi:beta-galactosidase/beta-glucuronidase